MKKIAVEISESDLFQLELLAEQYDATPKKILQGFLDDLVGNAKSGGSDERELAREWLGRQTYRW